MTLGGRAFMSAAVLCLGDGLRLVLVFAALAHFI